MLGTAMDSSDVNLLVQTHLPYATALSRRFRASGYDRDDLEQEAAMALVEAAKKFDPNKNPDVPFVAFARRFLVRRLGALANPEAWTSLSADLPAPFDSQRDRAADELWSAMDVLADREQTILTRLYGLDGRGGAERTDLCVELKLGYRRLTELIEGARAKLKAELIARGWRDELKLTRKIKTA